MTTRWEYLVVKFDDVPHFTCGLQEGINKMGKQGWQVAAAFAVPTIYKTTPRAQVIVVYKREKPLSEEPQPE